MRWRRVRRRRFSQCQDMGWGSKRYATEFGAGFSMCGGCCIAGGKGFMAFGDVELDRHSLHQLAVPTIQVDCEEPLPYED